MGWNPTFTQLMVCGFFSDVVLFSNVHFCTVLKMHFVVKEKKSWAHRPISYSCFLFHQNNDSLYVNTHINMNSHPDSGGHPGNNLSLDFQKTSNNLETTCTTTYTSFSPQLLQMSIWPCQSEQQC